MSVIEKARIALDPSKLDLPESPRVLAIEVEPYEDASGDDALRVYVIMPDDVEDSSLTGDNMLHLKQSIRNSLLKQGIDLFPYVRLRTKSQRREELAGWLE